MEHCSFGEQLKAEVLPLFLGDLCPGRLVHLQSARAVRGTGARELLLPASEHVCGHESQKDALEVEGDG